MSAGDEVHSRVLAVSSPRRANRTETLRPYVTRLVLTDTVAIAVAMIAAHLPRFGPDDPDHSTAQWLDHLQLSYVPISVALIALWLLVLSAYHTYDARYLGTGTEEYRNVAGATLLLFGGIAVLSYLFKLQISRGYFLVALPVGLGLLLISRWLWRKWLNRERVHGRFVTTAIIVGGSTTAAAIAQEIAATPEAGLKVAGCCVADKVEDSILPGTTVPVLGTLDDYLKAADQVDADTVIITSSRHLTPNRVRRISWSLEPTHRHLALAPSLIDVAGPRIHVRPMSNISLMHVETPRFDGRTLLFKRTFDVIASGLGLVVLSPLFLVVAIIVKAQDDGPVFFRQARVGRKNKTFHMWKFRSMVVNAEERLAELKGQSRRDAGNEVMFKLKNDPRVTPIGKFIRRTSIDELPQLINVFKGDMSLVGPRPPLLREVERYEERARRKFLVRPGITGLWQVSGRSNLTWDEAVRLDLFYVENWSFIGDLQILFRTFKVVLKTDGAY